MADTTSKTFTENVNHVAELDNSLGYELALRRSNIVLKENVIYSALTEVRLFNRTTNMTEAVSVPSDGITAAGLNVYLGAVKTALELAYPECVMTHSVTHTVSALGTFNNAQLAVVLSGNEYYLRSINIKISETDGVKYDIDGQLAVPLEITPKLLSMSAETLLAIESIFDNKVNINAVAANETNINIVVDNIDKISVVADDLKELVSEIEVVGADLQAAQSAVETVAADLSSAQSAIAVVTDNLESIVTAADGIQDVTAVATSITDVVAVSSNLPIISSVHAHADVLDSVYADKATLDSLYADKATLDSLFADKAVLDSLYADKDALDSVYADLPDVETVAEYILAVSSVAASISDVRIASDNIEDVNSVALNITAVTSVSANIEDVLNVSTSIDSVEEVAANLGNVNLVSADLSSVIITAESIEDVKNVAAISTEVVAVSSNSANINVIADNLDALLQSSNATAFIELELAGTVGQVNFGFNYTDPDAVEVFYNGRLLSQADWYLANGDTLTLAMPVDATGDILIVRTWNKFNITDAITDEDLQDALFNMYSKSEVDVRTSMLQAAIDANTAALLSLATAEGQVANAATPVFNSIPKYPLTGVLDFVTILDSTDTDVFELDATNNLFKLYQPTTYTFLSTVEIKSNVSAARTVTFNLIDNATNNVVLTQVQNVILASGNTESYPMSTLLTIEEPTDIRVEVTCSDTGYEFRGFSSILMSAANFSTDTVIGTISDFEGAFI